MKIKKLITGMLFAAAAISLASCSKEDKVKENNGNEAKSTLTFNISVPVADPVTYARLDEDSEYKIKNLYMYEFDANTDKLVADPVTIDLSAQTGPDYTYKKDLELGKKTASRFLFVANEAAPVSSVSIGISRTEFLEKLAATTMNGTSVNSPLVTIASTPYIPMTGHAVLSKNNQDDIIPVTGHTKDIYVALTRIVARIDLVNYQPNLKITSATLVRTNSQGYLFPQTTSGAPSTSSKISIPVYNDLGAGLDGVSNLNDEHARHKKLFYLYEGLGDSNAEQATAVILKGTFGGNDVVYTIPFIREHEGVDVQRNHLYTIVLGEGVEEVSAANVKFTIQDTPWNEYTLEEVVRIISAKLIAGTASYNENDNILTVNNQPNNGIKLDLHTLLNTPGAFKATVSGDAISWITLLGLTEDKLAGSTLTVNINENRTNAERTGSITITTENAPNIKYVIKVVQKA